MKSSQLTEGLETRPTYILCGFVARYSVPEYHLFDTAFHTYRMEPPHYYERELHRLDYMKNEKSQPPSLCEGDTPSDHTHLSPRSISAK